MRLIPRANDAERLTARIPARELARSHTSVLLMNVFSDCRGEVIVLPEEEMIPLSSLRGDQAGISLRHNALFIQSC
jgi:hypothetical protein